MTPLAGLIAHWERRGRECAAEIDGLVDRWNAETRYNGGRMEPADVKRMCAAWEGERRIARDTVAWLKVALDRSQGAARR
jgi:hypothetical protein